MMKFKVATIHINVYKLFATIQQILPIIMQAALCVDVASYTFNYLLQMILPILR